MGLRANFVARWGNPVKAHRQRKTSPGRPWRGSREWSTGRPRNGERAINDWRDRLPRPLVYYSGCIIKLGRPNGAGWAQGRCPFHDDGNASLSVHVLKEGGRWRCFAGCGQGDLVSFHQRRTGMSFREALADLMRGGA